MARRPVIELSEDTRKSAIENICSKATKIGKEILIDQHYEKGKLIRAYKRYNLNFPECDLFVRNWYSGGAIPLLDIVEKVENENILKDIPCGLAHFTRIIQKIYGGSNEGLEAVSLRNSIFLNGELNPTFEEEKVLRFSQSPDSRKLTIKDIRTFDYFLKYINGKLN